MNVKRSRTKRKFLSRIYKNISGCKTWIDKIKKLLPIPKLDWEQ
ncbi:hypothetical protein EMIT0180MI3_40116 [Priestia megaterium]